MAHPVKRLPCESRTHIFKLGNVCMDLKPQHSPKGRCEERQKNGQNQHADIHSSELQRGDLSQARRKIGSDTRGCLRTTLNPLWHEHLQTYTHAHAHAPTYTRSFNVREASYIYIYIYEWANKKHSYRLILIRNINVADKHRSLT